MIQFDTDRPNILIVDDTPENLSVLSKILTMKGYQVRPAIDGHVALTSIQSTQPDLILLDILMPTMSGFEVCERVKADAATRDIPIIFISALDATADKVKAFQSGGVDYVTKPFRPEEVLARVETHLALRRAQKKIEDKNVQLQNALNNVKTLSGLLPTCAKCKKIRDDQGYWNSLERYIEQHLDVLFSHGLCPQCLEDFYEEMEESRSTALNNPADSRPSADTGPKIGTILLIDDSKDDLSVLAKILSQERYHIQPAINGELALNAVRNSPPDLILLDILLPDMDGYDICRQLKMHGETGKIPVIFISALTETHDKMKAFQAGGVDYITKPFQPEEVLARVQAHLTLRQMQIELRTQNMDLSRQMNQCRQTEELLRRHNDELAVLNRMNHTLQKCRLEEETYAVVAGACEQLFPSISGTLFREDDTQKILHETASWGTPRNTLKDFLTAPMKECCRRETGISEQPGNEKLYSHLQYFSENDMIYAPICHRNERMAVLILDYSREKILLPDEDWARRMCSQEMLIENLVEYYALSLSNLKLHKALQLEAIQDPLTGLYNRRHMEITLQRELYQAERRHSPLAIVLLDIDHFKKLNDSHGHDAGDAVLRQMGQSFRHYYRREDVICRYGGEEFLLILSETSAETAIRRVQEFLAHIAASSIQYEKHTFHITLSAGIAAYPEHGTYGEELIHAADIALYQAKERGRNHAVQASSRP